MKRVFTVLFTVCCIILCSCAKSTPDETYFVHAAGISESDEGTELTLLLEKSSDKDGKFFTATVTSSGINDAAKELKSKYSDCYFATCRLYVISKFSSVEFLKKTAEGICDSNLFPTTSRIICTSEKKTDALIDKIYDSDAITKIEKSNAKNKVNVVSFFARYASGKTVKLDEYALYEGKIKKASTQKFSSGKDMLHEV